MTGWSGATWVGLVASLVVCVQHQQIVLGFGWALVHGAGVSSLASLLPTAAALAALWAAYAVLRRMRARRPALVFGPYALALVVLNESVAPGTPLKTWRQQRAIEAVEVRNVRDEFLLSPRGNPIGIRLAFEAVFPRTGAYSLSASTLTPLGGDLPRPLGFDRIMRLDISPAPSTTAGRSTSLFEEGRVYAFTQDMLPGFLSYDDRANEMCLADVAAPFLSEADFRSALASSTGVRYRTSIQVDGDVASRRVVLRDHTTARGYDLAAMYRTATLEAFATCAP